MNKALCFPAYFHFFSFFFFGLLTNFMHFLTFGGELTSPVLWNPTCLLLFAAILWLGIFSGKTHVDGGGRENGGDVACIVVIIL